MPVDFQSCLDMDARLRKALLAELADAQWAEFGKLLHDHLISDKLVTAVNTALLEGGDSRTLTRKIRTYLLTGTIAR